LVVKRVPKDVGGGWEFALQPYVEIERGIDCLHVWVGPVGAHLSWPPWQSRPDYCRAWREVPEAVE
jgi:hypothetical protein